MADVRGGVAVFVLSGAGDAAQLLLLERAHGAFARTWCPVAGNVETGEREADAALRELREETGLAPERFYSTAITEWIEEEGQPPRRLSVFVAFVPCGAPVVLDREHHRAEWLRVVDAYARLPLEVQRAALARIEADFLRRAPDEALRLA